MNGAGQGQQATDPAGWSGAAPAVEPHHPGAGDAEHQAQGQAGGPAQQGDARRNAQAPQHRSQHQRVQGWLQGGGGELAHQLPAAAMADPGQQGQQRQEHQGGQQDPQRRRGPHGLSTPA